jgi:GDP-4-dehydro-6-deoxy-D-mannose reductase
MTKILVTGAQGFIGKRLCEILDRNYETIKVFHDSLDILNLAEVLALEPVDHVFHLAGSAFVPKSWESPPSFISNNTLGTTNILDYCRKNKASLTFLSSFVYGNQSEVLISENVVPVPNNPYALSKLLAEQVCQFYKAHFGVKVTIFRPFNIFGPHQSNIFLIPLIIKQVIEGKAIEVRDLNPRRDYLYIDDLIELLVKTVVQSDTPYPVYNVGYGKSYSVREIIQIIQDIAGTNLPVISLNASRENEIMDLMADIELVSSTFHWKPLTTISEGIKKIFEDSLRNGN